MTARFSTLAVHAGYRPESHAQAGVAPIYCSAAFNMQSAEHGDALSAGEREGFSYSRVANPTVDVLERRIAALEGGGSAVAFASGMGAVSAALLCAAEGGGRVIASKNLYGASVDAMHTLFPQFGVYADFVDDVNDIRRVEALMGEQTRAIFVESVANPSTTVTDVEALSQLAHRHGIALIVDNTVPTPYLFRPFDHGADVVVHSTTKGISGHGNALGGMVVDSGCFDWTSARYPQFARTETVVSDDRNGRWHSFASRFGRDAYIQRVRISYLRTFGAVESPMNAYLQLLGVETLAVRLRQQVASATAIAEYLKTVPQVRTVHYSGLALGDVEGGRQAQLVRRYYPRGVGGVLSFEVEGGREHVARIIDGVRVFSYVPNIGDARSLIVDPARITHREVSPEFRESTGVGDNLIRLSIGLEDTADLIEDLDQAIRQAYASSAPTRHGNGVWE